MATCPSCGQRGTGSRGHGTEAAFYCGEHAHIVLHDPGFRGEGRAELVRASFAHGIKRVQRSVAVGAGAVILE
jgi:hypothetical protein